MATYILVTNEAPVQEGPRRVTLSDTLDGIQIRLADLRRANANVEKPVNKVKRVKLDW